MPAWNYDSYCNDYTMDYLNEVDEEELFSRIEDDIMDFLKDAVYESDLEFIIGIGIFSIRKGKKFPIVFLKILLDIIDILLEYGQFFEWYNPNDRKEKLIHESKIIKSIILKKHINFSKIKIKPKNFFNLSTKYYKVIRDISFPTICFI